MTLQVLYNLNKYDFKPIYLFDDLETLITRKAFWSKNWNHDIFTLFQSDYIKTNEFRNNAKNELLLEVL